MGEVLCCVRWAGFLLGTSSVSSIITGAEVVCGDQTVSRGGILICLIYLHLETCSCKFGSEVASVQHVLTGKGMALKEVAISSE